MKSWKNNKKIVLIILAIGLVFWGKYIYNKNVPPRPVLQYGDSLYMIINPMELDVQDIEQLEIIMTIEEEVKVYPRYNGQAYKIPKGTNIYKSNIAIGKFGVETLYCEINERWFYCLFSTKG